MLGASGCSWCFVQGPPEHHEQLRYFDCTTSKVAPVIDTAGGVIYGITGGTAVLSGDTKDREASIAALAAMSAASAASAVYGFLKTSDCEDAKAALMLRIAAQEPAPLPGCLTDLECKGDRICERGACVAPVRPGPAPSPVEAAPPQEPVPPAPPAGTPLDAPVGDAVPTPAPDATSPNAHAPVVEPSTAPMPVGSPAR